MALKLYKAETTNIFYFLAEEGEEGEVAKKNFEAAWDDDRMKEPEVSEVKKYAHLTDWEHGELVYGTRGDVSLKDAFELAGGDYEGSKAKFLEGFPQKT